MLTTEQEAILSEFKLPEQWPTDLKERAKYLDALVDDVAANQEPERVGNLIVACIAAFNYEDPTEIYTVGYLLKKALRKDGLKGVILNGVEVSTQAWAAYLPEEFSNIPFTYWAKLVKDHVLGSNTTPLDAYKDLDEYLETI